MTNYFEEAQFLLRGWQYSDDQGSSRLLMNRMAHNRIRKSPQPYFSFSRFIPHGSFTDVMPPVTERGPAHCRRLGSVSSPLCVCENWKGYVVKHKYVMFISVINQHDAQNFCFTISFISYLYMFRAHVLETCRGMK